MAHKQNPYKEMKMKKESTKACAVKCGCDKETKKLMAENAKLQKALASATAKAEKAAKASADKLAKANAKVAKLQETVAALKAKKK